VKAAQGLPLIVTLAPEAPGAAEVIDYLVKNGVVVSLGTRCHLRTDAKSHFHWRQQGYSFVQLNEFFHHREPGPIGTALFSDAYVELIVDGVHVHPATVGLALKAKGFQE